MLGRRETEAGDIRETADAASRDLGPSARHASSTITRPLLRARLPSSRRAAGWPNMSTGRIARVRGPIAARTAARSIQSVAGSTSTKTLSAPVQWIAEIVPISVFVTVITSSPRPIPSARSAICSETEPEFVVTACAASTQALILLQRLELHRPNRGGHSQ